MRQPVDLSTNVDPINVRAQIRHLIINFLTNVLQADLVTIYRLVRETMGRDFTQETALELIELLDEGEIAVSIFNAAPRTMIPVSIGLAPSDDTLLDPSYSERVRLIRRGIALH